MSESTPSTAEPTTATAPKSKATKPTKVPVAKRTPHAKTYPPADWMYKRDSMAFKKRLRDLIKAYKNYKPSVSRADIRKKGKDGTSILDAFHYFADMTEASSFRAEKSSGSGSNENVTPKDSIKY